jgi:hypothetical protein
MYFNNSSEKRLKGSHCPRRMGEFSKLYQDRISNVRAESRGCLKAASFLFQFFELRCMEIILRKRCRDGTGWEK